MLFPDSFIDELKQRLPISKVIGNKIKLKRYGIALKGLCPFHQEKTPSFTVSDHKGIYYCFGCHASGDVIQFISETEKLNFNETVKYLASIAGIALPKLSVAAQKLEKQKTSLIEIIVKSAEWFSKQLKLSINYHAYEYFINRGLSEEDIKIFSLGYAPAKGLLAFLNKSGISNESAVEAGLAIRTESNNYIERFRSRVIFPIKNHKNQVVGFGGRALDSEIMPKYLNSPENLIYKKRYQLYGLFQTKHFITQKKFALIVEGNTDLLKVFQYGFRNVVASLGTALTENQIKLLARYTKNVYILYDGDDAGQEASSRAIKVCLENNIFPRIISSAYNLIFIFKIE